MKSLRKKLFLSILAVAFAVVSLATSTFAWFSMNDNVQVSGMKVRTQVSSNLLVSADNVEEHFGLKLAQSKNALLEPVSSIDGLNFWYSATDNVLATGDAKTDNYAEYNPESLDDFHDNYGSDVAVGYVDYALYLKATSTKDNSKIALTSLNLSYKGAALGDEKAFRAAVFANEAATSSVSTTLGAAKTILAPALAANFEGGKAVNSANALGTVLTPGVAAVIDGDIDAGVTKYYYVVVRLWLEGEDTTCNNDTFADLTGDWQLDLKFEINENPTGVTEIGSVIGSIYAFAVVDATEAGVTLTDSKLSNGVAVADVTYQWYNAADNSSVAGATTAGAPTAAAEAKSYYCLITATDGNIYRTAVITVPAA